MKKEVKRIICCTVALVMLLSSLCIFGVGAATDNTVRVIVQNETFAAADGAPWIGKLIDTEITLQSDDSMESVLERAVKNGGYQFTVSDYGYISSVNGLAEYAVNGSGGWMAALNDWFTADATTAYTVSNGTLRAGDELVLQYSCSWGADVGSLYGNFDTSLQKLTVSGGTLSQPFDPDEYEYDLYIGSDEAEISLIPEAYNKNYQVRTYLNEYRAADESAYIRRGTPIKVVDGDSVYVGIGSIYWPSMNTYAGTAEQTIYTFNIKKTVVKGDINGDGVLDIQDITLLQRHLAEYVTLTESQLIAADVDGDGEVNINDATAMQRILAEY